IALPELPAALGLCKVLVTNDSGPMHIAVARAVPVVAIFCATTSTLGFYPYSSKAIVLEKDLSCRPCSSHGGRRCPLGTEDCIRLISPEHVFQAVERLLDLACRPEPAAANPYFPRFVTVCSPLGQQSCCVQLHKTKRKPVCCSSEARAVDMSR